MATGGSDRDGDGAADDDDGPVDKLTCAICLERYQRPKILPCFHTFCQRCLQSLAGDRPTLPCPACRKITLLPPGGVSALQGNFYLEEDLDNTEPSPRRRLCDICTEDREATHKCVQCQQRFCLPCRQNHDSFRSIRNHTVTPLTQEVDNKSDSRSDPEMCPKHPEQCLLLRCRKCQADICLQCKLTQHEGHFTEDLSDTKHRARSELEAMLGDVARHRQRIAHLTRALTDRRAALQQQQQDTQQDFQGRAQTLHQWVDRSLDEAVNRVQTVARDLDKSLQDQMENMQNMDLALRAQQDHMVHVLKDGKEADVVSLQAQLQSSSLLEEAADLKHVEKMLTKNSPMFDVKHGPCAVNQVQLREFIGVLQPVQPASLPALQSQTPAGPAVTVPSQGCTTDTRQKKAPREFVYSRNKGSSVIAMCPISQGRLWVIYWPARGSFPQMKLFDADGQVLASVNKVSMCSGLVAISDDTVLCWKNDSCQVQMVSPDGKLTCHKLAISVGHLLPCASSGKHYLRLPQSIQYNKIIFSKTQKPEYADTGICWKNMQIQLGAGDASVNGDYIAGILNGEVKVYTVSDQQNSVVYSSYIHQENYGRRVIWAATDVRFCQVDGQELLLVCFQDFNKIHIVDHTDGGRLVRYLDTGILKLSSPQSLATDFDRHVWVGCRGGKVVVVDM